MMRMAAASDMMYMKVVGMVMVSFFVDIIFLAPMMIPRTTLMETKTEQQQKVERNLG